MITKFEKVNDRIATELLSVALGCYEIMESGVELTSEQIVDLAKNYKVVNDFLRANLEDAKYRTLYDDINQINLAHPVTIKSFDRSVAYIVAEIDELSKIDNAEYSKVLDVLYTFSLKYFGSREKIRAEKYLKAVGL
uniref:Uncharacterized protein n=1 Tax=Francisella tularensis subsp. novicida PA10-7858 TaxID=1386968 RepID=V5TAG8_FRANO|nr:hypothetical protein [Francisella tularensis]AHB60804.1 hypothetical protein N894_0036 [Francisella tularensis subsp. novicida PA10-7858]